MEWTIKNDCQSVTVGINYRLALLYRQGLTPTMICLGKEHSRIFWAERYVSHVPNNKKVFTPCDDVVWDEIRHLWLYKSRLLIPMRFNDPQVIGIAVINSCSL